MAERRAGVIVRGEKVSRFTRDRKLWRDIVNIRANIAGIFYLTVENRFLVAK